jgi:lipooligosaccharide transport system ATP-binding protein
MDPRPAHAGLRAPALEVRDLHKAYGALQVVRGVSLRIERGECFGLLGPNGAGKTTLLRLYLGLALPDQGRILLNGLSVPRDARRARAGVGVVPQADNLDPDFTVEENLRVYSRYFGLPQSVISQRLPGLLAFAGLEGKAREPISALSGGMKRRLSLARALVNDPDILLLDEPTTGLDPQARHLIWERLRQLAAAGKTLLLTTHFMDEAERLCNRVAIMDAGRIVMDGDPRRLIAAHIEPQVVEVFGEGVGDWLARGGAGQARRVERVGDTVFCYLDDPRPLLAGLAAWPALRSVSRPADLEDLFLKLTGRGLRD